MKFQVKYSELFCRFSITNSLKRLWMGGLCQNIQLVLVFLKAPLLELHFCYYTLMTFLMKLFVILISMLRVSHSGAAGGGREGASYDFLTPPIKTDTPNGKPQKQLPLEKWSPLPGNDPRKKPPKNQKLSSILVTVSLIKQHWKKMTDIPQKRDFCTWSIHSFVGKVKQYVRKYYITYLIDLANKLYDVEKFFISFYSMCY